MVIFLILLGVIGIIGGFSFLVVSYNQLLLGYQAALNFRKKILECFIGILQKLAVFSDDYQNYLTQGSTSRHNLYLALGELKDWLNRAVKELNQQWDYEIVEVVFQKLRGFIEKALPDEKLQNDKNLEFIQKSEQTISRFLAGYKKVIDSYNERVWRQPHKFIRKLKGLPENLKV